MRGRFEEDGDGQVDGDASNDSAFVAFAAAGGLGTPPWHLWGNTQVVEALPNAFTNPNINDKQITLCRVGYGRPETWRFMLSARLISAPATGPADQANASVWFELMTGIGRSAIVLPFWVQLPSWSWNFGATVPVNLPFWTAKARTDSELFSIDNQATPVAWTTTDLVDTIIGQDMTLVAHVSFTTNIPGVTEPAVVEVSGQFAPNTHVRPDWLMKGPPELRFAGGEVKGK